MKKQELNEMTVKDLRERLEVEKQNLNRMKINHTISPLENTSTIKKAKAGNIGCGKTTLTKMLAKRYGWVPRFESVDYNPYLEDFYKDMKRWSFNLQVYFLNTRFKDVVEISKSTDTNIRQRNTNPSCASRSLQRLCFSVSGRLMQ